MSNYIKNSVKKAIEISSSDFVKEDLREITYKSILNHLLNKRNRSNFNSENSNSSNLNSKLNEWEKNVIENLPPASKAANGNRNQQTIWAVVKLYSRGEEANRHSVPTVIKDELGVTPQSGSNTSNKLKELMPTYLSRSKDGKKYLYEPTKDALKIFENN